MERGGWGRLNGGGSVGRRGCREVYAMCFVGETLAKYRYFSVVLRTTVFAWGISRQTSAPSPFLPKRPISLERMSCFLRDNGLTFQKHFCSGQIEFHLVVTTSFNLWCTDVHRPTSFVKLSVSTYESGLDTIVHRGSPCVFLPRVYISIVWRLLVVYRWRWGWTEQNGVVDWFCGRQVSW